MNRRRYLSGLGAMTSTLVAGCSQTLPTNGANNGLQRSESSSQSVSSTQSISLPGEPIRKQDTTLDIQGTASVFDSESEGFDGSAEEYDFDTEPQADFEGSGVETSQSRNRVDLDVSANHIGTGQAFGLATGGLRTAWEAPATGRYRLSSSYVRNADILYDQPTNGSVSASFDTSLVAINHDTNEVISKQQYAELQHKNGTLREELAEWFISKGVTYLISSALGLGLVARVVLGQIIGELVELGQKIGNATSQIYDIYHRIKPNRDNPTRLATEFEASEGDVFVFEMAPTLEFGFEIADSWWYQPTSKASVRGEPFYIEEISS